MFRTVDEFLALTGDDAPTPAERQVIDACRAGAECILEDGTRPEADTPERRIRAPLLRLLITGGTDACGLAERGVDVRGAWIAGTLDLDFAKARGKTTLFNCHFADRPKMMAARLQHLNLSGSALPGLMAQGVEVGQSVFLRNITATGTVDVNGARIGGQLDCEGATLDGGGAGALIAQGVEVGESVFLNNITANGTVDVNSARIAGQLACDGATLEGGGGKALNAQMVGVGRDIFLSGITATGVVDMNAARIDGYLYCDGATLLASGAWALNARGVEVAKDIFLSNSVATGSVDISGARCANLYCDGTTLDGGDSVALNAQDLRVTQSLSWRELTLKGGLVNLTAAHVGTLTHDVTTWSGGRLNLVGFSYDRIAGAYSHMASRLDWLESGSYVGKEFVPQPYVQLARVYREMGYDREARVVLREMERRLAEQHKAGHRNAAIEHMSARELWPSLRHVGRRWGFSVWDFIFRWGAGYGHRPEFALGWLVGFWLLGSLIFFHAWDEGVMVPDSDVILTSDDWVAAMEADPVRPTLVWDESGSATHYETFSPVAYSLDVVLPILDIRQEEAWSATTVTWFGWIVWIFGWHLKLAGWLSAGLFAATATGLVRRERE